MRNIEALLGLSKRFVAAHAHTVWPNVALRWMSERGFQVFTERRTGIANIAATTAAMVLASPNPKVLCADSALLGVLHPCPSWQRWLLRM
jgi:hypothetical protein